MRARIDEVEVKKMFKKVLAIFLALAMLLSFAACGDGAGGGAGLPSAEEIIERAVGALDGIKTYQFDMDMNMDMAGEVEGETFEEANKHRLTR